MVTGGKALGMVGENTSSRMAAFTLGTGRMSCAISHVSHILTYISIYIGERISAVEKAPSRGQMDLITTASGTVIAGVCYHTYIDPLQ